MKPCIHVLFLKKYPIFAQLQLEEALLRADQRNWCLINCGSPPAIVMGISGKSEFLINPHVMQKRPLPVIRRFSGGGTVVIDEQTSFITLICNSTEMQVPCYPDKVLKWTEQLYQPVFSSLDFKLMENDYVIGNKKFGGNAQYMRKDRWLHHSSLLWDFKNEHMEYLLFPPKVPQYRRSRDHSEFLCRLKDYYPSMDHVHTNVENALDQFFEVQQSSMEEVEMVLKRPHRKATVLVTSD